MGFERGVALLEKLEAAKQFNFLVLDRRRTSRYHAALSLDEGSLRYCPNYITQKDRLPGFSTLVG